MQIHEMEQGLVELLGDLTTIQDEMLDVLSNKQSKIVAGDVDALAALQLREENLCGRLQACHDRRAELLQSASESGLPSDSIQELSSALPDSDQGKIHKRAKETSSRMRLIQHQCLSNWVLAQRSLLHISQMLEIIATGGQIQPTYGKGESLHGRGSLVDQEV